MADNETEFAERAAALARSNLEEQLISASRQYEDSLRTNDEYSASSALEQYAEAQHKYNLLTGSGQQQQRQPGLSTAQQNFLSRRAAGGDQLTPQRMRDYARGHDRALASGLQPDTPEYFRSIEWYADHQGDGRISPLTESEAAKISGIDEQTYAANAARLRALKASGHYNE